MSEEKPGKGRLVCVTGASGYIGSHVVQVLLGRGYSVRATVRDPADEKKTAHLLGMARGREDMLELLPADLLREGSYDQAVSGCELVCHVAASVKLQASDPQREIVDPAVKGTANVLGAVRRAGTVKRVVITSSIAAIFDHTQPRDKVYTEADWNNGSSLKTEPYSLAKTLAERAAWDLHASLPEEERFELVALNPVVVMGPLFTRGHGRSSPALLRDIMARAFPACPRISLSLVDVRDVALAHALALENPDASGRYILHNEGRWMQEAAKIIAPHFPEYRVPTGRLPNLVLYLSSLVDKRITFSWVRRNIDRAYRVDNSKSREELGITYRPLEETLLDTCRSFIELGLVKLKR